MDHRAEADDIVLQSTEYGLHKSRKWLIVSKAAISSRKAGKDIEAESMEKTAVAHLTEVRRDLRELDVLNKRYIIWPYFQQP